MKIFKKIAIAIIALIILIVVGGYLYFDQKFTPEDNYLTVKNESGRVPITWLGTDKNVLLIPVKFPDDSSKYYMQFDTGSPYTLFYSNSIKNIKGISVKNNRAKTSFQIGNTQISSDKFKLFNNDKLDEENDSIKIIGTIGADILEDRNTAINLKGSQVAFNLLEKPKEFKNNLSDFKFKKRKIIIKAFLNGNEEKFIYDSGTSAYELLTNKEIWKQLKSPNSKVVVEKAKSWENTLTSYTANCKNKLLLNSKEIPLNEVTYVEGFSEKQYLMMKFSGMTGMLGNKIFLKNCIYIDCIDNKIGIN
ncbi:hypothetical protein ACFPVY_03580 [Flavobacterium qiangtangense]|uniref:Aspartyl protease n=1 Tax=Flavobacterium qiangtangense TaxID=1442595 RepID=A0ABW1PKQ5_9FLAO